MKKLIYFGVEAMLAMAKNKGDRVIKGRLVYGTTADGNKGWMFIPYNRKPRCRRKDEVLHYLAGGWIKLSALKLKVFASTSNKQSPLEAIDSLKYDICEGLDAIVRDGKVTKLKSFGEDTVA
jgi:hypothetical protein